MSYLSLRSKFSFSKGLRILSDFSFSFRIFKVHFYSFYLGILCTSCFSECVYTLLQDIPYLLNFLYLWKTYRLLVLQRIDLFGSLCISLGHNCKVPSSLIYLVVTWGLWDHINLTLEDLFNLLFISFLIVIKVHTIISRLDPRPTWQID